MNKLKNKIQKIVSNRKKTNSTKLFILDKVNKLIDINLKLWKIEDDIRECERIKKFDQKFVELARLVYFTNDERAKVKNDINKTFGSELVEVKSYEEY